MSRRPVTPAASALGRRRAEAGWLFAAPFRPFFVGAPLAAAAAVGAGVHLMLSGAEAVGGLPPLAWHAHEMVFGVVPAIMAGYLLSATPNRSGRLPASGWPLAGLFAVWAAGRIVPLASDGGAIAALADAAFPLATAAALAREAGGGAGGPSRHGLMLFPLIAAASLAHRWLAADPDAAALAARAGVAVAVLLISAVGGRIVPSLTRNALAGAGAERVPQPYGRFDVAVLLVASAGLVAWTVAPEHPATAAAMGLAAALQAARLARWRGWLLRDGGILALHAGYAWVVAGTALAALAAAPLALVPADAALHAFTAGAIGTMTMAVMARLAATRGPGARALGRMAGAALLLVNVAAAMRVAAPLTPDSWLALIAGSAGAFVLAQVLFAAAQLLPAVAERRDRARAG